MIRGNIIRIRCDRRSTDISRRECNRKMAETTLELLRTVSVLLGVFVSKIISTHDVTRSMYMYLANHFTPQECLRLTAHLYAGGSFESAAVEELGNFVIETKVSPSSPPPT